jgi:hypothetical protein
MWRVGFSGTTLAGAPQLSIVGGYIAGRNAGGVGAMLDVDFTDGVILGGFTVGRYTNVVRTSANTQTRQIVANGWEAASISTMVSDATKVFGSYPPGVFNSSTRNAQNASYWNMALGGEAPATTGIGLKFPAAQSASSDVNCLDDYQEFTSDNVATTGAITTTVQFKATKVGNVVTLTLPATSGTASASAFFQYGDLLPTDFRPAVGLLFPCGIRDNGSNQTTPGMVTVNTAGEIRVYKDIAGGNYTAAALAGLAQNLGAAVSWTV